ncbi:hypothetical protein, partial [Rhodoferax sp.]|uniref:hypothetical protein n=1 Tax=Rhodoferax sp. TaxID=50421 RepID=UPI00260CD18C
MSWHVQAVKSIWHAVWRAKIVFFYSLVGHQMKRREFLTGCAVVSATPLLTSCSSEESGEKKTMYVVELWTDSNPED